MNSTLHGNQQAADTGKTPEKADWYVYYRVRVEHDAVLQARVAAMQNRLLQQCGVTGALKRRPQQRDGLHTWMEVYLAAPADFDAMLTAAVQSAGLSNFIDGDRHVEHFWDVTSCA